MRLFVSLEQTALQSALGGIGIAGAAMAAKADAAIIQTSTGSPAQAAIN